MSLTRLQSEPMRSGHSLVGRFVAITVVVTVMFACADATVSAQQTRGSRDYDPRERSSLSPLGKLDALQRSVKKRIKSAFGKKPETEPSEQLSTGETNLSQDQRIPAQTDADRHAQTINRPATGGPMDLPTQTLTQANAQSPDLRQTQTQRVQYRQVIDPDSIDSSAAIQNNRRPPFPMQAYPEQPGYPQPPLGAERSYGNPAASNPARPAYDSGYTQPPTGPSVRGMRLGQAPVTATEHALRLTEENGDLKAQLAALNAENTRLKDKLTDAQRMLDRSAIAVESARQEINTLSIENRTLGKRLEEAETKHKRYLLETDRILQSIREELDAVLVREISASGGG